MRVHVHVLTVLLPAYGIYMYICNYCNYVIIDLNLSVTVSTQITVNCTYTQFLPLSFQELLHKERIEILFTNKQITNITFTILYIYVHVHTQVYIYRCTL